MSSPGVCPGVILSEGRPGVCVASPLFRLTRPHFRSPIHEWRGRRRSPLVSVRASTIDDRMTEHRDAIRSSEATILVVTPAGERSPLGPVWSDVMKHVAKKISWIDGFGITLNVFDEAEVAEQGQRFQEAVSDADIFICIGLTGASPTVAALENPSSPVGRAVRGIGTRIALLSSPALSRALDQLGGYIGSDEPLSGPARAVAPFLFAGRVQGEEVLEGCRQMAARHNTDDLIFMTLLLVDTYVSKVPALPNKGMSPGGIFRMLRFCSKEVVDCMTDPTCKRALDELQKVGLNDQVGAYRAIVSFETPKFAAFSLCVLQKQNCMDQVADIPSLPEVSPMASFRGKPLTHESAESIFLGSLKDSGGDLDWSWRVVAGQNAAYDQFPCQYQLFYRGKSAKTVWYDPVFQVKTLDGKERWCRRHYRVRRAEAPGVFWFSVLDNGVTSMERWKILDADDGLTFGVFFYQGAAKAAGLSYTGCVVCTRTGEWPSDPKVLDRIERALKPAGIEMWELYKVDNSCSLCENAPLGVREGV